MHTHACQKLKKIVRNLCYVVVNKLQIKSNRKQTNQKLTLKTKKFINNNIFKSVILIIILTSIFLKKNFEKIEQQRAFVAFRATYNCKINDKIQSR